MNRPPAPTVESPDRPVSLKPCCLHLRHKLMFVDPRHATPGLVDDSSDTRVFVCQLTQYNLGPDDEPVSPKLCDSGGRACFRGASEPITPTITAPQSSDRI